MIIFKTIVSEIIVHIYCCQTNMRRVITNKNKQQVWNGFLTIGHEMAE
jgi:hypothetical protein